MTGKGSAAITYARAAGIVAAAAAFALPKLAAAQGVDLGMEYAGVIGLPSMDIRDTIGNVVRSLLGFLGMLLVLMILWSGFRLMTAGGDEEKIQAAKGSLRNAVVGFLLIMMSVSITRFVVNAISASTGGNTYL